MMTTYPRCWQRLGDPKMGRRPPSSKKKSPAKSPDRKRGHRSRRLPNKILEKAERLAAFGKALMPPLKALTQSDQEEERKWALPSAIKSVHREVVDGKPFEPAVRTAAKTFALNPTLLQRKFLEQHGSVKEVLERQRFLAQPALKKAAWERELEAKRGPEPAQKSLEPSENFEDRYKAWEKAWEKDRKAYKRGLAKLAEVVREVLVNDYRTESGETVRGATLSAVEKHLEMISWRTLDGVFSNRSLVGQLVEAGFKYVAVRKNDLKFMVIAL